MFELKDDKEKLIKLSLLVLLSVILLYLSFAGLAANVPQSGFFFASEEEWPPDINYKDLLYNGFIHVHTINTEEVKNLCQYAESVHILYNQFIKLLREYDVKYMGNDEKLYPIIMKRLEKMAPGATQEYITRQRQQYYTWFFIPLLLLLGYTFFYARHKTPYLFQDVSTCLKKLWEELEKLEKKEPQKEKAIEQIRSEEIEKHKHEIEIKELEKKKVAIEKETADIKKSKEEEAEELKEYTKKIKIDAEKKKIKRFFDKQDMLDRMDLQYQAKQDILDHFEKEKIWQKKLWQDGRITEVEYNRRVEELEDNAASEAKATGLKF